MAYFPDPAFKSGDFGGEAAGAEANGVSQPAVAVDPLEDGLATAQFLAGKADIETTFAADPDPAKPLSDYDTPLVDVITKSAGRISDPEHGKAFTQSAIDEAAAARKELAQQRQKQLKLQEANAALDAVRTAALKLPGETGKARLIDAGAAVIAGLQHHGLLTPEEGQQRSRGWVEDYAVQTLKMRPVKEQIETLRSLAEGSTDPGGSIFALIPPEQRERLAREADRDATIQSIVLPVAKAEKWKRDIIDASEDLRSIPRATIENDPELDDVSRDVVLRLYDEAQGKAATFNDALQRFKNNEGFSPDNPEDRENAGRLYGFLGANDLALKAVVQRTGILPEPVAEQFRAGLDSGDPKQVAESMQTLSQLSADHPNILDGVEGGEELKKSAQLYERFVSQAKLAPEEAAEAVIAQQKTAKASKEIEGTNLSEHPGDTDEPLWSRLLRDPERFAEELSKNPKGALSNISKEDAAILAALAAVLYGTRGRAARLLKYLLPKGSRSADENPPSTQTESTLPAPAETPVPNASGGNAITKDLAIELGKKAIEIATKDTPTAEDDEAKPEEGASRPSPLDELSPRGSSTAPEENSEVRDQETKVGKEVLDTAYELRRVALRRLPTAVTLRGDELGAATDKKDLRQRAQNYMRRNFIDPNLKVLNKQQDFEIEFNGTSIDKSTNVTDELLRLTPALPDMLREATLLRREKDRSGRPDLKAIYKFVSAANLGSKRIDVELIVRETKNGKFQYSMSYALKPE